MRVLDELAALCGKVCDEFSPGGSTASEELCARVVLDVVTISDWEVPWPLIDAVSEVDDNSATEDWDGSVPEM